MKRLSIIVPVYNVGPYIERCLRSIEDQNISKDDLEVICINDGSTDNSRELIISLQNEFINLVLFDQVNQGVSAARNQGISMASGKYVMMVDSDDYLVPNCLEGNLDIIENRQPDIAYSGHIIMDGNMKEEYRFDPDIDDNEILSGIEYINKYMKGHSEIRAPHSSVGIFYRTEFFKRNEIRYLENVPFLEDGEFLARVNCLANKVVYLKGIVYVICKRPGSATTSRLYYSDRSRTGFLKAANELLRFKYSSCGTEQQRLFMNQHIIQFTIIYMISYTGLSYLFHYSDIYKALKSGQLNELETTGCSEFYKSMGESYNNSIHCFYLTWYFYKLRRSLFSRLQRISRLKN